MTALQLAVDHSRQLTSRFRPHAGHGAAMIIGDAMVVYGPRHLSAAFDARAFDAGVRRLNQVGAGGTGGALIFAHDSA